MIARINAIDVAPFRHYRDRSSLIPAGPREIPISLTEYMATEPADVVTGTIVIAGGGYYGSGPDLITAKRNFTNFGGRLIDGYGVYTFDDATEFRGIDAMGRMHFVGNSPTEKVVAARKSPASNPFRR